MLKIYEYAKCSTCVKAIKFLENRDVSFKKIAIVDQPPSLKELKGMLETLKANGGSIRQLFNTSGLVYKEMKLSEKLPEMTEGEALKLLASNGKLIKRPFVWSDKTRLVGFKEEIWKEAF